MKDKAIKYLRYLVLNSVFAYAIYAGVINNVSGWANIAKFMIIAMFIIGLMIFFLQTNKDVLKSYTENSHNRIIPKWVDRTFDGIVLGVLVYYGWIWYGAMFLFSGISMFLLDSNAKAHVLSTLTD